MSHRVVSDQQARLLGEGAADHRGDDDLGVRGLYLVIWKPSASSERMFAAVPGTGIRPSWTGVGRSGLFVVDEARGWGITLKAIRSRPV